MTDNEKGSGADQGNSPRSSKVARVISEYDLDNFGVELENRWLGNSREQQSLRTLADVLNRRILKSAMTESGMLVRQDRINQLYTALTDDETTEGTRLEVLNELNQEGVDTDAVQNDFVSHQAIHTYLREERGVERENNNTDQIAKTQDTIERLQGRLQAVTEKSIKNLISTGRLVLGSFDVIITIQVVCTDCSQQYDIVDLFERGHCDCRVKD
ncbi:rod-determining factor RdfA [Haloarcula amylovorans]|uniref:rod-determining factor RdfA n=1 Tax=Haloarcula amylovorans TaxID=2562280 RepID=UPI0010765320|nr:rod-determining factor RdfA [Halomicroarcula amylolytica]